MLGLAGPDNSRSCRDSCALTGWTIGARGVARIVGCEVKPLHHFVGLLLTVVALPAFAADADHGKRLSLDRCAVCHIVISNQREEIADSPPFEMIGAKFGFNSELIAAAVLAPHPRMNLTLRPSEAHDIAAYISSLAR
jgi:mono/diheme cytochrome c family protein